MLYFFFRVEYMIDSPYNNYQYLFINYELYYMRPLIF